MSTDISLHELLDLSIGTPDVGSVNFSALHTLLHAILGHLKIERVTTTWKEADDDHDSTAQTKVLLLDKSSPYRVMEEKLRRMEEQMRALEALPSASELMGSDTALSDMWTLMQLRRKAQGNEDGVSKVSDSSAGRMQLTKSTSVHCGVHKCAMFQRTTTVTPCFWTYSTLKMKGVLTVIMLDSPKNLSVISLNNKTKQRRRKHFLSHDNDVLRTEKVFPLQFLGRPKAIPFTQIREND